MENDEKQSEDLPKYRLRATAMKTLLANAHQEGFSKQSSKLFSLIISNNEARASVFTFCQTQHPLPLISNIMDLLYDYYSKENSASRSESESNEIFQYLIDLINKQLPSSFISKVDLNSLSLIDSASHLASLFPSGIAKYMSNIPTNQHQVAFLLNTLSYCDDISDYITLIQPLISQKTSFSTLTFSELKLLSKHEEIENAPPVKTLISFCKSLPENEIFSYAIPTILCVVGNRLQAQSLKEIPAFISYLIKKSKKDAEHLPDLCAFIDKVFEFPDSITLLRPLHEDLVAFFITNAQINGIEINDEMKDPTICGNKFIIKSFLNFISKFGLDPFDCLMQTRDTSIGTMILAYSAADSIVFPKEEFKNKNSNGNNADAENEKNDKSDKEVKKNDIDIIESFLKPLISQIKQSFSPSYQFLIRVCGICANKFSSHASLRFLVSAISLGSNVAYDYLINGEISFDKIFPEIVNNFKPGRIDSLYIQALQVLLQANQTSQLKIPVLTLNENQNEIDLDDSEFDNLSKFDKFIDKKNDISKKENSNENENQNQQLTGSPTTETILFCNVASSVLDFPEYLPLLGPSAAMISTQFAMDLITNIQKFEGEMTYNQGVLLSYSNSIYSLDIEVVYSLALTFQMILHGQSMLFLGISLQRLPPEIILESLQKVTPYSQSNPVAFGKMVSIVAISYPNIALTFTESFISSSATKRRVFFIFKTSETSEDTLITVFYIIGYCSSSIDSSSFINDFLSFSTSFMSKYLVSIPKNQEVIKSSLFSIQRLCNHVQRYQDENKEHSFQFKEFLENYVTSILKNEVDKMVKQSNHSSNDNDNNNDSSYDSKYYASILLALASLIPLRPVLNVEKCRPLLESASKLLQSAKEKSFQCILKSTKILFAHVLESNPSFESLISISLSVFPCFLRHRKWSSICQMMNDIFEIYDKKIISFDVDNFDQTTKNIDLIVVNSLPLLLTDECGQFSSQILYDIISFYGKIQNSSSPSNEQNENVKNEIKTLDGEKLCAFIYNFLSKSLLNSQTFEIISLLLESLKDEKLLEFQHKNIAMTIKHLFEMKGIDDQQIDSKIVFSLILASTVEEKEVSQIILDTIEIISKKDLQSILSVLVSQDSPLQKQNEIFTEIIKRIISNEKSAKLLISYLASSIYDDENESTKNSMISFATKIFPMIRNSIDEIDNDTWSKLFIAIVKQTHSIESPLFKSLFKNNGKNDDKKDLYFYSSEAASQHPSSLPLILSYFPEKATPLIRKLSLAFALFSKESCHSFLNYALKDLDAFENDDIEILIRIFKSVDKNLWKDLSSQFIQIIINFIAKNEIKIDFDSINQNKTNNVIDNSKNTTKNDNNNDDDDEINAFCGNDFCLKFLVSFLKNVDENGRKLFWEMTASQAIENMNKYARVFLIVSFVIEIDVTSLIPIIPKLCVISEKVKDASMFLYRIYQQIDDDHKDENEDFDVAIMLLKSKALLKYKIEFLNKFVEMMIHGEFVSECITCISSYINEIDESTADVIETLIMQLPKVNEADQKQISLMLQKVLI